jgi:APA family basic amino acid/polyamine antiporter
VLSATLLAVVAATGSIRFTAAVGGVLYVLHFVVPLIALIALRRRGDHGEPAFRTPAPRLVLPLAFAACATLAIASGADGAAGGAGWLALGVLGYLLAARRRATPAHSTGVRAHA